jgi:hypothetical protein
MRIPSAPGTNGGGQQQVDFGTFAKPLAKGRYLRIPLKKWLLDCGQRSAVIH